VDTPEGQTGPDLAADRISCENSCERYGPGLTPAAGKEWAMSGSSVFDLGLGLALVFFLVSLICSAAAGWISRRRRLRERHLEEGLRDLVLGGDPALVGKIYQTPLVRSLAPPGEKPAAIPGPVFMRAALDAFAPGAPASGETALASIHQLEAEHPLRRTHLWPALAADRQPERARENFEAWFGIIEKRMTEGYRRRIWRISLLVGVAAAILFNIDTFSIGGRLWRDSALRAAVAATAASYAQQAPPAGGSPLERVRDAVRGLEILDLPIGWGSTPLQPADWAQAPLPVGARRGMLKLLGWLLTGLAGAQGAPFWYDVLRKATRSR
jgi:hypothetical protein